MTADYDRLSSIDGSFLRLERPETPMHVGSLAVFESGNLVGSDGRFRLGEVRDLVSSRLHLIPRFRKRVQAVPLDAGEPIWVDDDRFDIGYHVRLTALPRPGTRAQLLALFERVQSQMLDRSRPLWEIWFVEGLEDGHIALFQKTHHALVDGVSGVDVATVLLDFTPEPTILDAPEWRPQPAPPPARVLIDTVRGLLANTQQLASATRRAAEVPRRAVDRLGELTRSLTTLTEGGVVAPRTSLNHPIVGRSRRFAEARVSLDDVKAVRRAFGGTVNDVVLTGVAGGLARLLDHRGELHPELVLKVFCPVSVRDETERMQLGNRVSAMFVPVAVGELDPLRRLAAVRESTQGLKEREQAVGAAALLGAAEWAAPTLLGLAARLVHHQPFVNLVCTNIPGPQEPLYCMGARMLEAFPMVPLARNLNLGVAILSYCGELHLGLLADRDQWGDLDVLVEGIDDAFAELAKLAAEAEGSPDGQDVMP
ncbi:MAG TPA: wax ester/triacylglycerol synthase family O-acyltransferase [Acidimicrobiia bacterium]|nr:wax ester/triacylglycerol synthase family O-acyltransferase [Acidimicrobiia bacterium]